MAAPGQEIVIKDALVVLFAAGVIVPLLKRARVPAVLGFVAAGIALGPSGLGQLTDVAPALTYLTISDVEGVAPLAELGVLFLLFLLGLEMSFEKLWALRKVVFGVGSVQAAASAFAIGGAAYLLGLPGPAAAVLGLALALSSTAIVMQVLIDERRAATPVGRTALGVLLFQDILVAPILIFVGFLALGAESSLSETILRALVQGVLAVVAIYLVGRFLLRRVFGLAANAGGRDFLMALTLLTVVGASVLTASAGLSLALGAFLAGLLLGETEFKHQTEVDLEPFKGILLGLFFMTVGMNLDLAQVIARWPEVLGALAALLAVKALIVLAACRLILGKGAPIIEPAALLAPAGEFAFVVFGAALAGGVIDTGTGALGSAVAGLSMMLIPVLGRFGKVLSARHVKEPAAHTDIADYADLSGHVIVAGYGRVGRAICNVLAAEEAEFVALDRDQRLVRRGKDKGRKVYLGDAGRPEILSRAGADGAAMVIVTVNDADKAREIVAAVRSLRPAVTILARAQDTDHAVELKRAGATFVIPDAIEAGLQLAARALEDFGYAGETVRDLIAAERDAEYKRAESPAE